MRGNLCLTFKNVNGMTLWLCLTIPLDILTIYSPSITLNLWNIFLLHIQGNFSWTKQILLKKKLLSLIQMLKLSTVTFIPRYDKRDAFGFPIVNGHLSIWSCMSPIISIVCLPLPFDYDYIFKIYIKEQHLLHPMKYLGDKLTNQRLYDGH